MHFVGLCCIIISQCTVKKTKISQDVCLDRFSHKCNVKIWRLVPDHVIIKKEGIFILMKNLQKVWNLKNKWQLKEEELPLEQEAGHVQCPTIQVAMHKSLKVTWEKLSTILARQKPLFLLQDLFIASIFIIPCLVVAHCSFDLTSSNNFLPASVS